MEQLKESGLRPFWLDTKLDAEADYYSVRFERVQAVPVDLSLIVGDCAHNLRSALDHLAWHIVPITFRDDPSNVKRSREIAFPITEDPTNWKSLLESKVPRISTKQKAIIRSHQPFNLQGASSSIHPLARLSRINNTDKHRVVLVTVVRVAGGLRIDQLFVTEGDFWPSRVEMLDGGTGMIAENGAEVARIHGHKLVGREKAHVGVTSESESFIGFDDGYPLVDGLKLILEEVEKVIEEIEGAI
jgi:hypothetical protein